jgi:hypothetical protein
MVLDEQLKQLLDGRAFAVLATPNADGTPQTSVIWAAPGQTCSRRLCRLTA